MPKLNQIKIILTPALLCLLVLSSIAFSEDTGLEKTERSWRFKASLDGKEIGEHTFSLVKTGNEIKLTSKASFRVKFLFITAYTYDHMASEEWNENCLTQLSSETKEDSTQTNVILTKEGTDYLAIGPKGKQLLGECPMTFAYWNPKILEQRSLLNPQTGEWLPTEIISDGEEIVTVRGIPRKAERFSITAPKTKIELWYVKEGSDRVWVALQSLTPDGYTVKYDLL
jgi:hypothetical protein